MYESQSICTYDFCLFSDVPTVNIQQSLYSVTTGQSVTLVCTVSSTLTVNNVQWQRNVNGAISTITSTSNTNKYSGSTTNNPSLTIFNADSNDAGVYTCFATNSVGTGQSTTTTLTVTGSMYYSFIITIIFVLSFTPHDLISITSTARLKFL